MPLQKNTEYTHRVQDWSAARTKKSKEDVLRRTDDGHYGKEVRFSLFGLGEYDPKYPPDAQDIRNMKFYARLLG